MLENGWKRLLSGFLALVLVIGMLPPVNARAEDTETTPTEAAETMEPVATETEEPEVTETEPVETDPVETDPEETEEPALPENVAAVQALIDALPDLETVTAEDYDAVQDAYEAYEALTEEEKALVQGAEVFEALFAWFNAQTATLETLTSGTCGDNLTWVLNSQGKLTISGTGNMTDYFYSNVPWYSNRSNVASVVIENGVTSIGRFAFYECSKLVRVTIPESVISIGDSAFRGCSGLTSVTIPKGVTSIGDATFYDCSGLTSITIPESVTSIGHYVFFGCSGLTSVTIPKGVTSIGDATFYDCSGLTSVTIPESVTSIGEYAFYGCSSLTSVTIPKGVISIGNYAFYGCSNLTSITIPEGVTSIGSYTFEDCSSLTSVTIPESVTSIGHYMFFGCSKLTDVFYGGTIESWLQISIDSNDSYLREATIHCVESDGISHAYKAGTCGDALTWILDENGSLTITGTGDITNYSYYSSVPWYSSRSNVTAVVLGESVTSIGNYAFYGCSNLTSITIPEGVTSIGHYAFYYCSGLTSVTIPESVTSIGGSVFSYCSKLTDVYYSGTQEQWDAISIGSSNTDLTNAIIHTYSTVVTAPTCTEQGYTTHTCTVCGDSYVDSLVDATGHTEAIDEAIAPTCTATGLTEGKHCSVCNEVLVAQKTVPANGHNHKATVTDPTCTEQGYTTHTCTVCGDSYVDTYVDALGHDVTLVEAAEPTYFELGNYAYYQCERCEKLFADADATQQTTLEEQQIPKLDSVATGECGENLKWVLTDDGILTISGTGDMANYDYWTTPPWAGYRGSITAVIIEPEVTSIGRYAFHDCRSLCRVVIGEDVTCIGECAFQDCSSLTDVAIPASVETIEIYAFFRCAKLITITFDHRATDTLTIHQAAFELYTYSYNNEKYCPTVVRVPSAKRVPESVVQYDWERDCRTVSYHSTMEIPAQSMTIQAEASEAEVGIEIPMTLKVEPADTTSDILWTVIPGTGTATVTRQGVVTGLTAGTVTVRATSGDSADIYAEASLTILPSTGGDPTAITVTTGGLYENEVAVDETISMQVVFTPANASSRNVTWEVQNGTGTAKIDENGNLTGLTPGAVTVYATTANGIENSCTVNVVRYAESVQIFFDGKSDTTSMGIGETKYLSAVLTPENTTTTEVEWWIVRGTGAAELECDDNYYYDGGQTTVTWITGTEAGTITVVAAAKDSHAVVAKAELEITDTVRAYAVTGGNIYYNTETGWITGSDNTVTNAVIPSKIEGTTIVGIASDAFANVNNSWHNYYKNTTLTSVSIPATVKEIGRRAFYNCTALSNLRFAGTSQLTTIGEGAFCDCESLTNLTIPDSVSTVGSQAFSGLDSLKNLTLSGEANSSAWGISSYRNGWLETITYTGSFIRSGSREYNANGGYWIEYPGVVSGAKKLILAETVTEIGDYAFGYGYPTEEVEIRGQLTSIGEYAFEGFYNLKTINLPDSLTHLGKGCFYNCNSLEYLTLSKIPDVINEAVFSLKNKATIPDFIIQATNGKVSLNWCTAGVTEEDDDYWKIAGIGYWNSDDLSLICEGTGKVKLICEDTYTGLRGSKIIQVNGGLLLEPMELGYMIAGQSQPFTAYDIAGTYSKVSATWCLTEGGEYASITTSGMLTAKNVTEAVQVTVQAKDTESGKSGSKTIWILPKTKKVEICQQEVPVGSGIQADLSAKDTLQLSSQVQPQGALTQLTWYSSNKAVATVDENGIVHLLKPGTTVISATAQDGTKLSDKVTLTVYYVDTASKLTATADIPAIGLQIGQSVPIAVQGAETVPSQLLNMTTSSPDIAQVVQDDAGNWYVCGGGKTGTATITATIAGDPLNRKATVKVKVIAKQAQSLLLTTNGEESSFNGEPLVILDAQTVKDGTYTFLVASAALDYNNDVFGTHVSWTSSNTAIATVADNKDGTATVTVKKGAGGECAITATAKDAAKVSANLWLSVRDYQPRLESNSLSMNLYQTSTVETALLESYGNAIESVSIDGDFTASWENSILTIKAPDDLTKGIYTQTLTVTCINGETYSYTLKIKATETAPTVTVKQTGKYNLFYIDGTATLKITAKGATVSDVIVTDGDFDGTFEDGTLTLTGKGKEYTAPGKQVTLKIQVAGYEKWVEKTVTLATVTTAPKLKLSATSSVINTGLKDAVKFTTFQVLNGTDVLELTEEDITYSGSFATCKVDGDITLTLTGDKGGTATFNIQQSNWTKSVKLTHKVTVQTAKPTTKLSATTLKLNSVFPAVTAEATVSLSQANLALTDVKISTKTSDLDKVLSVTYKNGKITAKITGAVKAGTYTYICTGYVGETELKSVTLKVTVSATTPKVKLASTTFKLNTKLAGEESVSTKVTVPTGYTLVGFDTTSKNFEYKDGYLIATLGEEDAGGSYTLYPILKPNGSEKAETMSTGIAVKVTTYSGDVTATVSAKGKLDTLNPDSAITYTVKLKNCAGTVSDIKLSGQDAELFEAKVQDGKVIVTMVKDETYATSKTYKVTLDMKVCGVTVSKAVSFKVSQSTLKVSASPATVTFYQSTKQLTTTLKVTSPTTAKIADVALSTKTAAAFRNALGDNELGFNPETGKLTMTLSNPGLLTPGKSYTVYLDVTPVGNAENVKPILVKLTVKVQK